MCNFKSTPNTIFHLLRNLCELTLDLHPLWIQPLPMVVTPKNFSQEKKASQIIFLIYAYG